MKKRIFYLLSCIIFMTSLTSCSDSDSSKEEILPLSVSIVNGDKQDLVLGKELALEAKVENGLDARYEWTLNGEDVSKELTYTFVPQKTGSYNVQFTAYTTKDEATASVVINVYVAFDPVKSIDDIQFWTGEGKNKSVLSVQWISGDEWEDPEQDNVHFLSWGYRWDEKNEPTGQQMILEIAKADPFLFVFLGASFGGIDGHSIRGFGYDANGDGQFSIKNSKTAKVYTASDFKNGVIFIDNPDTGDGYASVDPADYWFGGWYEGYCSYYLGDDGESVPEKFDYSGVMAEGRYLTPNSWDSWSFSSINSGMVNTLPLPQWMVSAIAN